jgi:hypothetical protein
MDPSIGSAPGPIPVPFQALGSVPAALGARMGGA